MKRKKSFSLGWFGELAKRHSTEHTKVGKHEGESTMLQATNSQGAVIVVVTTESEPKPKKRDFVKG